MILSTKGTDSSGIKPELIELLEYFHNSTEATANKASSDFVKKLDKMLESIKNSPKFGGDYMSYQEAIYTIRKTALQEGMQRGMQEGKHEGKNEERSRIERKLRESGMSENEIRAILAE
ncbi:MAG: hypothetical protein K2J79_03900 [Ruminiclostridium sp.]|nr:hypothetical protein [Ruminiclostridium sp.]